MLPKVFMVLVALVELSVGFWPTMNRLVRWDVETRHLQQAFKQSDPGEWIF